MRENVEHNRVLDESVLIVSIEIEPVPYIPAEDAWRSTTSTTAMMGSAWSSLGVQEQADAPALVRQVAAAGSETSIDLDDVTYFLSKIEIVQTEAPGMAARRKRLFLATAHLAAYAVDYFKLPRHRTAPLGSAIEI